MEELEDEDEEYTYEYVDEEEEEEEISDLNNDFSEKNEKNKENNDKNDKNEKEEVGKDEKQKKKDDFLDEKNRKIIDETKKNETFDEVKTKGENADQNNLKKEIMNNNTTAPKKISPNLEKEILNKTQKTNNIDTNKNIIENNKKNKILDSFEEKNDAKLKHYKSKLPEEQNKEQNLQSKTNEKKTEEKPKNKVVVVDENKNTHVIIDKPETKTTADKLSNNRPSSAFERPSRSINTPSLNAVKSLWEHRSSQPPPISKTNVALKKDPWLMAATRAAENSRAKSVESSNRKGTLNLSSTLNNSLKDGKKELSAREKILAQMQACSHIAPKPAFAIAAVPIKSKKSPTPPLQSTVKNLKKENVNSILEKKNFEAKKSKEIEEKLKSSLISKEEIKPLLKSVAKKDENQKEKEEILKKKDENNDKNITNTKTENVKNNLQKEKFNDKKLENDEKLMVDNFDNEDEDEDEEEYEDENFDDEESKDEEEENEEKENKIKKKKKKFKLKKKKKCNKNKCKLIKKKKSKEKKKIVKKRWIPPPKSPPPTIIMPPNEKRIYERNKEEKISPIKRYAKKAKQEINIPFVVPWEQTPSLEGQSGMNAFGSHRDPKINIEDGNIILVEGKLKSQTLLPLFEENSKQFASQKGLTSFGSHRKNVENVVDHHTFKSSSKENLSHGVIPKTALGSQVNQSNMTPFGKNRSQITKVEYNKKMTNTCDLESNKFLSRQFQSNSCESAGSHIIDCRRPIVQNVKGLGEIKQNRLSQTIVPRIFSTDLIHLKEGSNFGAFRPLIHESTGGHKLSYENEKLCKLVIPFQTAPSIIN